ncbi:TonB family protein [Acinetobacter bohemicus]|uniref:TonB family protein n=1 Tax=Acinetobacter lwoffii TaxID=28090 RepID=A0A9D2UUF5_ACILW|nr:MULTISPECIES: TonB family protein [Acinetobacter]MDM1782654.1 energy transducer TonB [Acinetobacter indicus]HJF28732.1 TonB family protein [Acinetobacter lwoffii]MCO8041507.1 TonB family protein [Acinetobacter sp. S4400-12]MCO8045650.1 TonB family protein [Acinetobacter sp. S4397-1]MCU7225700.1 TonB family protein [Acinetobacter bohemicus]
MPLVKVWWKDPVFSSAVLAAVVLHLVVLTLEFAMPQDEKTSTKEIAVSLRQSENKVEQADFLGQTDQQGSGKFREVHRMSSDQPSPFAEQKAGEEQQDSPDMLQQQRELSFEEKVLMTTLSWQKQAEENQRKKMQEQLNSQFQAKAAMVASLEAQYLQRQQNFSRQQKIKTVDGIQAKQDVSAAYLEKFRQKVEFYGNRYYPDAARQQNLAGEVRLMVILNQNGGIRAIRLIDSSGHHLLDEAAKASVRKAAPFGAFDSKMKDISELRIIRTWRFDPAEAEFEVR